MGVIEDVFKQMKDRRTGTWWPMFHWTDQMIRVHGLYCSLSLLIRSLILKRIQEAEMSMSMNKLHEKLSGIREVLNVFPKGKYSANPFFSKNIKKVRDTFELI